MLTVKIPIGPYGVILDLKVCVSTAREAALRSKGGRAPNPASVAALLDTGADCSLLDASVILSLGLRPTGMTFVKCLDSIEGDGEKRPVFDVDVLIVSADAQSTRFTMAMVNHSFGDLPYKAIVGRDLLEHCTFHYDGPDFEVTLSA